MCIIADAINIHMTTFNSLPGTISISFMKDIKHAIYKKGARALVTFSCFYEM